jgi:hypothetical protein
MQVVRSIPIRETAKQHQARLTMLSRQLLDPITAASAALRLEALGKEGVDVLHRGLESGEPEIRFYAAEALAYLDDAQAAAPLAEAARSEPAFRAYALAALAALDDYAAAEKLRELLSATSAETRYGAFRALWARNSRDALVRGEVLNDQFSYHILPVAGPPMIHLTRSYRPEVVLFGTRHELAPPLLLEAGTEIMVNGQDATQITVSRFRAGQSDQKRVVSYSVDEVIRAIADLGGTYPDVVQMLQSAEAAGVLMSRLQIEAVPRGGRTYRREGAPPEESEPESRFLPANPLPGLFSDRSSSDRDDEVDDRSRRAGREDTATTKRRPFGSFLATMFRPNRR